MGDLRFGIFKGEFKNNPRKHFEINENEKGLKVYSLFDVVEPGIHFCMPEIYANNESRTYNGFRRVLSHPATLPKIRFRTVGAREICEVWGDSSRQI